MPADEPEPTTYGSLPPEDALSLIGNEVRASILRALSDARGGLGSPPVLSFSELRERADADVDSSQFNYHLQQLVGHFVERRDGEDAQLVEEFADHGEDGYALRPEGTMLTRTVRAGTTAGTPELDGVDAGFDCYFCGTPVEAAYRNWLFKVACPDCEHLYDYNLTPPGVVADDEAAVLDRVTEFNRHVRLGFARGVCPLCANAVETTFLAPGEVGYPRPDHRELLVNRACDHCGNMDYLTLGEALLRDPALVAFCYDHGRDVTTDRLWDIEFAMTDRHVTVRSTDPWRAALELAPADVAPDGEEVDDAGPADARLEIVVHGDLSVVERTVP